ncbi:hypothetical protein Cyrtocomes_00195 [Candidatus Cyrtobacter comes]|uniref:Uncharacterized protein n=1 Tax=Candidatus Cyrtobacter comes TaxID=675776 RepID=A0ABU5L6T0_9RICK|nr:hypothetical protein [Candidatus Cyrtobacter comes]
MTDQDKKYHLYVFANGVNLLGKTNQSAPQHGFALPQMAQDGGGHFMPSGLDLLKMKPLLYNQALFVFLKYISDTYLRPFSPRFNCTTASTTLSMYSRI